MTPNSEPQFLRHLRAQRLPIPTVVRHLFRVPAKLQNRNDNRQRQSAQQHHEHAADILHAQRVRLRLLVLVVAITHIARILPPLVVQNLYHSLLLQLQDRQRNLIAPRRTLRRRNPVALRVQQSADLRQITVALHGIIDHRRFHQERIVTVQHALDAILVGAHERRRLLAALHEAPHLLVQTDLRIAEEGHRRAAGQRAVRDFRLIGQIGGVLDGRDHAFDGQKGGQIGRVRGDYDEREEPPDTADDPG